MQRRRFIKAMVAVPVAATAVRAQVPIPSTEAPPSLEYSNADAIAVTRPQFFSPEQFTALQRLADLLVPAADGVPSAVDCHAPEFLDFLIGQSPPQRQQVYQQGLDILNRDAHSRFAHAFGETSDDEAAALMAPLHRPWRYAPEDPLERFLRTVYPELRTATRNSRAAALATGEVRSVNWLAPLN